MSNQQSETSPDRSATMTMANNNNTPGLETSFSSLNSVDNDTSVPSSAILDTQPSASTSVTASPAPSRDPSPSRTTKSSGRTGRVSVSSASSSRKNSLQERNPSKTRSNIPTLHAAPRPYLSSTVIPSLPPPSDTESNPRAPVPQKSSVAQETSKDTPRWPISPRLKSPPPNFGRPTAASSARRIDSEQPIINVQRATPSPHVEPNVQYTSDIEVEDSHLSSGMRTPNRGPSSGSSTLETVQEVSQPNTPRRSLDAAMRRLEETSTSALDGSNEIRNPDTAPSSVLSSQNATNSESGSDSGSIKTSKTHTRRSSSTAPPPLLHNRQSSSALKFSRGQPSGESSSRNMTVETEEVTNMAKLSLIPNAGGQGANGSLRTRPSTETIKPRKEKKKHIRKNPVASGNGEPQHQTPTRKLRHSCSRMSMSSAFTGSPPKLRGQGSWGEEAMSSSVKRSAGTRTASITSHVANLLTRAPRLASSKADIFEAKVASAVEEANSSDSDETFVYDSNPPDVERPRHPYHSRTPSAASMASQVDRNGVRIPAVMGDVPHPVAPVKRNPKFVNTYNSNGNDSAQGEDDGRGTGRSNVGSTRGTARHHHHPHPGRWGRNTGNNHLSLFDNESPFPNAARSKLSGNTPRQSSNPSSPRLSANRGWLTGSKRQMALSNGYDMDNGTPGADDEQTPLLQTGSVRSVRSNRGRRALPLRNLESQSYHQNRSFLNRFASCLVLTVMLLLVITGAIGFMFATSQPLTDVALLKIGNVLASEQELMFDLTVQAHNPNVVVVMIDQADIEVFAKSPHAGNDSEWWRHPQGDDFVILDDPKDDPPHVGEPHDDDTSPNMRLGNIHTFDSPLTYEGSFFQRGFTTSSGELRLARPGNATQSGTERWERIIADDFTLVIKGVLKYTLPLSQKVRKVSISGKTLVKPNAANDPASQPREIETRIEPTTWAA